MSQFIYFLQSKGLKVVAGHLAVGIVITGIFTALGMALEKIQSGVYIGRLLLWQCHLLWFITRDNFIERYADGSPVYAGIPFLMIWLIGVSSGIPIYSLLSMAVHYRRSPRL